MDDRRIYCTRLSIHRMVYVYMYFYILYVYLYVFFGHLSIQCGILKLQVIKYKKVMIIVIEITAMT